MLDRHDERNVAPLTFPALVDRRAKEQQGGGVGVLGLQAQQGMVTCHCLFVAS